MRGFVDSMARNAERRMFPVVLNARQSPSEFKLVFCTLSLRIWGLRKCGAGEESIPENCAGYDYLIRCTAASDGTELNQIRVPMSCLLKKIDISEKCNFVLGNFILTIIKHAQFLGLAI